MIDPKLYTLLTVVECGNYTRAAQQLSLTQPAVSQHIKQLERELNIRIFNRVGNQIKPTSAGNIVIRYARRSIALHESMEQSILDEQRHRRRLTVGITHTAESNAVVEVLAQYSANNPGTSISIITESISNLYDMLRAYEVDLIVVEGKVRDNSLSSILLDTDSLVLIVAHDHPFAKKSVISIDELKKEPLILRRASSGTRNLFTAHLESQNISLDEFNLILEVDNIATIKDLIRRGIGVSILARSACADELKKGKLAVLPIQNLGMVREINIIYHKDFQHMEILRSIIQDYDKVVKFYAG